MEALQCNGKEKRLQLVQVKNIKDKRNETVGRIKIFQVACLSNYIKSLQLGFIQEIKKIQTKGRMKKIRISENKLQNLIVRNLSIIVFFSKIFSD